MLRKHGVVGKFVEFYGEGVAEVPLANRATLGNMSPEFGSTAAIFPIDEVTVDLPAADRPDRRVPAGPGGERTPRRRGMWHDPEKRTRLLRVRSNSTSATVVPSHRRARSGRRTGFCWTGVQGGVPKGACSQLRRAEPPDRRRPSSTRARPTSRSRPAIRCRCPSADDDAVGQVRVGTPTVRRRRRPPEQAGQGDLRRTG